VPAGRLWVRLRHRLLAFARRFRAAGQQRLWRKATGCGQLAACRSPGLRVRGHGRHRHARNAWPGHHVQV